MEHGGLVEDRQIDIRVTFSELSRAAANRAVRELRDALVERVDKKAATVSINKDDEDSQDAGSTLALLFGSSAAVAIAQGIRAYLARRGGNHDGITIRTADETEVVATGEAARSLDAPALLRAANRTPGRR
jgi:hypothetical protein